MTRDSSTPSRFNFGRKLDGKRHVWREIRCRLLGWHEESAFYVGSQGRPWCWYCGEDM